MPKTWADVDIHSPKPIGDASLGLVGYKSTNDIRPAEDGTRDEPTSEELAAFRRWTQKDEAVHKIISWTTRKDYPIHIGISLEIPDWVGPETHEIQFWETATFLPPIATSGELYDWLVETLRNRSRAHGLPSGMPPVFEGLEVTTERTGKSGKINK